MTSDVLSRILSGPVILSAFGGFTLNILSLLEVAKLPKERRPDFKDILYWLPYLCWPVLAAVVGFVYYDPTTEPNLLLSFQIGLSTPLILQALARQVPVSIAKLPDGA